MFKIYKDSVEIEGILLNTKDESEALKMLVKLFDLKNLMVILTKEKHPIYYIPNMEYEEFLGLDTYELEKATL